MHVVLLEFSLHFASCSVMLCIARTMLSQDTFISVRLYVCLSVRLSVTGRYSVKVAYTFCDFLMSKY